MGYFSQTIEAKLAGREVAAEQVPSGCSCGGTPHLICRVDFGGLSGS